MRRLLPFLALGACAAPAVSSSEAPVLAANALSANALSANALSANALTASALVGGPELTAELADANARAVMKYVASCALDPSQSFAVDEDGTTYTFSGELGLAPSWGRPGGSCDEDCRRWVSACVIARVDYYGIPVEISLRGKDDALVTSRTERALFTHREAAYWGDVFARPIDWHACVAPPNVTIPRVCGPAPCPMPIAGSCDDVCKSAPDGAYLDCAGSGRQVITVYTR